MQTVGFKTEQELAVPEPSFNKDGIASLIVTGGRYSGTWKINVCDGPADSPTILGSVWTESTEDPSVAVATATAWLAEECTRLGLKVAHVEDHSHKYGPDERPYFVTFQALLVDKDWT